ncbi:MAG: hypothetical protein ACRDD8_06370 [Bacteroidales bacterium]
MKKVFIYKEHKQICSTPEEAVGFISGIRGLTMNNHGRLIIDKVFSGSKHNQLTVCGCGVNLIRIYDAMGDTLEEHDSLLRKLKSDESNAELQAHHNDFMNNDPGIYQCDIMLGDMFCEIDLPKNITYSVQANCKHEAYSLCLDKAICEYGDEIKFVFPEEYSSMFGCYKK